MALKAKYVLFVWGNSNVISPIQHEHIDDVDYRDALGKMKQIRIFCLLNTNPSNHHRVVHVRETWGPYCDKLIFASTITDVNQRIIGFNVTNSHDYI